jgi:ankyrin repeat protein
MPTSFNQERAKGYDPRRVQWFWVAILALVLGVVGCKSYHYQVQNAVMTDNVTLLKQLDARGADLNEQFRDRFNWTPLIMAIYFQNTNAIAYLISRGVDVSKRDGTGNTALMEAITFDDTNTATLLFRKSPQAIRDGENWPLVRSLIQADNYDQARQTRWTALVDAFLETNTVSKVH